MEISEVVNTIIAISPAITALIGIIVSLIVGIRKIKATSDETVKNVKETNQRMLAANMELQKENMELKKDLKIVVNTIKKIKSKEEGE